ncbi:hypothetical protein EYF80_005204 [Liparis tanakae]|uniref:Uncharacterized protein n=1 Tax=Liparis tanakae TaxID=230148 RepID=A0A4Z2J3P8_9TELE|nr:hypothetical protein EYF80_005204 [Liparis tanakae]
MNTTSVPQLTSPSKEPKVARAAPPSPLPIWSPPLAGRTHSPGWSGSCWDCQAAGEAGRRRGCTDLENIVNSPRPPPITLHPILLSYPPSLLTLPHV